MTGDKSYTRRELIGAVGATIAGAAAVNSPLMVLGEEDRLVDAGRFTRNEVTGPAVPRVTTAERVNSPADWTGTFRGPYDGRLATVEIRVFRLVNSRNFGVVIKFTDSAGNKWDTDPDARGLDFGEEIHIIRDITLKAAPPPERSRRQDIRWPRLFLHTWDINFISGYSVWNGREYGLSFTRDPRR